MVKYNICTEVHLRLSVRGVGPVASGGAHLKAALLLSFQSRPSPSLTTEYAINRHGGNVRELYIVWDKVVFIQQTP